MLTVDHLNFAGERVLIRVDFNVPLDGGRITDDTRMRAALPTIQYVLDNGGQPILMSHLGRPKGKEVPKLSLRPIAEHLSTLLGREVAFNREGEIILLENLRFNPGEEAGDLEFAKTLASYGDCYVNDAFGTAHRSHASTAMICEFFPGRSAAGFLMQKEVEFLGNVLKDPKRPFIAIVGGAKVSSKLRVLEVLLQKADRILIGGAMAYTFLKAQGTAVGNSLVEPDLVPKAKELLVSRKIELPVDMRVAAEISDEAESEVIDLIDGIRPGLMGVDVGPKTIEAWRPFIDGAGTIFWNGPLGVFEIRDFSAGTFAMAGLLAHASGTTIVGGGDVVAAVNASGLADRMNHISTGGGASLEFIEQGTLPGIEALTPSS